MALTTIIRSLPAYLLTLLASVASAQTPSTKPAPPSPQVQAVRDAVAKAVGELKADLQSADPAKREAAAKALRSLSETVMGEILAQSDLGSAATRERMSRLFGELKNSAAAGEMLLTIPADEQASVIDLARRKPGAFNSLFADSEETVAGAVGELAPDKNAGATIARWALMHRDWQVRYAAINGIPAAGEAATRYATILLERVSSLGPEQPNRSYGGDGYTSNYYSAINQLQNRERQMLLQSLVGIKDERVLPYLLSKIIRGNYYDNYGNRDSTFQMLSEFKSKAVVVTLMDHIYNETQFNETSVDNKRVTCRKGDTVMWVILRQTDQDPTEYGFWDGTKRGYGNSYIGFDSDKARASARAKLRKWYEDHEKDYEGVERLSGSAPSGGGARTDLPGFVEKMVK